MTFELLLEVENLAFVTSVIAAFERDRSHGRCVALFVCSEKLSVEYQLDILDQRCCLFLLVETCYSFTDGRATTRYYKH